MYSNKKLKEILDSIDPESEGTDVIELVYEWVTVTPVLLEELLRWRKFMPAIRYFLKIYEELVSCRMRGDGGALEELVEFLAKIDTANYESDVTQGHASIHATSVMAIMGDSGTVWPKSAEGEGPKDWST